MKPTKKIIKLSKRINELGYRQEVKEGDWIVEIWDAVGKKDYIPYLASDLELLKHRRLPFFIVPSLEDGLLWLNNKLDFQEMWYKYITKKWHCVTASEVGIADTPHEAVLMAMVKVLESAGKDNV